MTPFYTSTRLFRFWSFIVSHNTLLIRSSLGEKEKTNIDLVFFGAQELHLVWKFDGLALFEGEKISDTRFERRFKIQSGASMFFIDALAVSVFENQVDTFEFYHPVNGPEDLGRRIAHSSG